MLRSVVNSLIIFDDRGFSVWGHEVEFNEENKIVSKTQQVQMLLKDPRRLPTLLKALFNLLWVQCVTLAGIVNSDNHVAVHPRMTKQVKAVVVAQLVERSLSTPEIHSSNPVIGGFIFTFICATNCIEKMKI